MKINDRKHFLFNLDELGDDRGGLAVIEEMKEVPFKIRRVFYEYNTLENVERGKHANKRSKFCLISIVGTCVVEVDDGEEKTTYLLDEPTKVLYIDKMLWKTMKEFSENNVLLVLSDQKYDGKEYVREYSDFIKLVKKEA